MLILNRSDHQLILLHHLARILCHTSSYHRSMALSSFPAIHTSGPPSNWLKSYDPIYVSHLTTFDTIHIESQPPLRYPRLSNTYVFHNTSLSQLQLNLVLNQPTNLLPQMISHVLLDLRVLRRSDLLLIIMTLRLMTLEFNFSMWHSNYLL